MAKKTQILSWCVPVALAVAAAVGATVVADRHVVSAATSPGKHWLMKMDADHDGTVSKDEMMKYMGAEFDKADTNHDGTLDARELGEFRANLAAGR